MTKYSRCVKLFDRLSVAMFYGFNFRTVMVLTLTDKDLDRLEALCDAADTALVKVSLAKLEI